jgi:hypothetical protein
MYPIASSLTSKGAHRTILKVSGQHRVGREGVFARECQNARMAVVIAGKTIAERDTNDVASLLSALKEPQQPKEGTDDSGPSTLLSLAEASYGNQIRDADETNLATLLIAAEASHGSQAGGKGRAIRRQYFLLQKP